MAVVAELDAGPGGDRSSPFAIGARDNAGDVMERSLELGAPPLAAALIAAAAGSLADDAAGGRGRHLRAQADRRRSHARPAGAGGRRRPAHPRAGAAHRRRAAAGGRALRDLAGHAGRPRRSAPGRWRAPTGGCWSGSPTAPSRSTRSSRPASGRCPQASCCAAGAGRSARRRGRADVGPAGSAERARPRQRGRRLGRPRAGGRRRPLQARRPRSRVRLAARAGHRPAAAHARPRASSSLGGREPAELEPAVRDTLRLGAYQLLYTDGVPPHAAVATSVDLVREARRPGAAGLVNAILRRVARSGADLVAGAARRDCRRRRAAAVVPRLDRRAAGSTPTAPRWRAR